jgi:hypothetical protein
MIRTDSDSESNWRGLGIYRCSNGPFKVCDVHKNLRPRRRQMLPHSVLIVALACHWSNDPNGTQVASTDLSRGPRDSESLICKFSYCMGDDEQGRLDSFLSEPRLERKP